MAKFGELIASEKPVLFDFYSESSDEKGRKSIESVAVALGDKASVIRINMEQNAALVKALRIQQYPTYIIYKHEEMLWRKAGFQEATVLIDILVDFVD